MLTQRSAPMPLPQTTTRLRYVCQVCRNLYIKGAPGTGNGCCSPTCQRKKAERTTTTTVYS